MILAAGFERQPAQARAWGWDGPDPELLARRVRNRATMSMSRAQIEAELHAAQRMRESALERRVAAEQVLWGAVRGSRSMPVSPDLLQEARREYDAAEELRLEAEAFVRDLQRQLRRAEERETRLLAITDAYIAREEARRSPRPGRASPPLAAHAGETRSARRGWLDRLRGR